MHNSQQGKSTLFIQASNLQECIDKTLEVATNARAKNNWKSAALHELYALQFRIYRGDYDSVFTALENIKQDIELQWDDAPELRGNWHLSVGQIKYYLGRQNDAKVHAEKALTYLAPLSHEQPNLLPDFCDALMLSGKVAWRYREFPEAMGFIFRAIQLILPYTEYKSCYQLGKLFNLVGAILLDMSENKLALRYLRLSEEIYRQAEHPLADHHFYDGLLSCDLVQALLRKKKLSKEIRDEVEWHIERADRIFTNSFNGPNRYRANLLKIMARYEQRKFQTNQNGNLAKAIGYLEQELSIRKRIFKVKRHRSFARTLNHLTRIQGLTQDLETALSFAEQALLMATGDSGSNREALPNRPPGSIAEELVALFNTVRIKLKLYQQWPEQLNLLNQVYHTIKQGEKRIRQVSEELISHEAKLILIEQSRPLNALALELLYLVNNRTAEVSSAGEMKLDFETSDIFELVQFKSNLLLREMRNSLGRDAGILHSYVSSADSKLAKRLVRLYTTFGDALRNQRCFPATECDKVIAYLDALYDEFSLKSEGETLALRNAITLSKIQAGLEDEKAGILSYFWGREKLFVVVITKQKLRVHLLLEGREEMKKLKRDCITLWKILNKKIRTYEFALGPKKNNIQNPFTDFTEVAHRLYQQLINPVNAIEKLARVYIVPDNRLWMVPFEVLLKTLPTGNTRAYHKLDYLISQELMISYHYSASIIHTLHDPREQRSRKKVDRLVLSSGYTSDQEERKSLEFFLDRYRLIAEFAQVDVVTTPFGASSDLVQHLKALTAFDAVYLYAHGKYQKGAAPKLQLHTNEFLEYSEMDSMLAQSIPWSLLILHACSSGTGSLRTGEGMVSFVHAFLARGVENIVYALFTIPRHKSLDIIHSVFEDMFAESKRRRKSICEALHAAKRKKSRDPNATPWDWAGLMFIGDQKRTLL